MRSLSTFSLTLIAGTLLTASMASGAAPQDPLPAILATIDGEAAKTMALELAGPAYRGRMTGEPEFYQAVERIEGLWQEWGVKPVAPAGSYRQPFTVLSSRVIGPATCQLELPDGTQRDFADITDFQPFPYGGSAPVNAEVIFAGYGITAPDAGYDDYAGIDVTGKIVFVMRHCPRHEMDRFGEHATFVKKAQTAHEHGAAGVVLVTDPNGHEDFAPLDFPNAAINLGEGFAAIFLHTQHAQAWFAPSGQLLTGLQASIDDSGAPLSFPMGVRATLAVPTAFVPEQPSVNAVGWIEGADPQKKKEIIVIGAHLDHLGYRGDRVYAGADDNGSGSVALLQVAQALATAKVRPARSILFVHFSGEEMGLLGSEYYVKNQMLPTGTRIVAMLNMDMVGLGDGGVTTLVPTEGGGDRLLGLVEPTRARYLASDFTPEQMHVGKAQGNSDHAPFARGGIPALFFVSSGDHPDYHQVGDTPDKLVAAILGKCARLCTAVAWRIAEQGVPRQSVARALPDSHLVHAREDDA